ncbi:MAG TPA: lysylphosphatidylglycerol synthase domain-containing protein [Polyangiaceae bacterium]|nr:lysylphosphatidylglycerol synthase domain-containing protein [Polyangiaceae bacterium]
MNARDPVAKNSDEPTDPTDELVATSASTAAKTDAAPPGKQLKRWLQPLMWLITAAFVVWTALDLIKSWNGRRISVDPLWLSASLVPVLVGAVLQGVAWIALAERMGRTTIPRRRALSLYFASQLARYTPGKVGLPIVRMNGAPELGLSRRLVGVSVLVEMLSWTATGSVVGFLMLSLSDVPSSGVGALAGKFATPLLIASLAGMVVLVAVDRRYAPAPIKRALDLEGHGALVPLRLPAWQLLYWLTWALHGYFLARALGATSAEAQATMGFSPLANVLGFVALAAPAGVGVREAVLVAGLGPVIGSAGAIGAAIASRLVSLVADLGTWLALRK